MGGKQKGSRRVSWKAVAPPSESGIVPTKKGLIFGAMVTLDTDAMFLTNILLLSAQKFVNS